MGPAGGLAGGIRGGGPGEGAADATGEGEGPGLPASGVRWVRIRGRASRRIRCRLCWAHPSAQARRSPVPQGSRIQSLHRSSHQHEGFGYPNSQSSLFARGMPSNEGGLFGFP